MKEVEKIVGKNGIDVVYDGVGLKTFEGSIEVLKIRGMMVAFGNASGYVDTLDVKKHINAKGLFFTRPSIAHYTIEREELLESAKKVFDAVLSGKFKIEISKKYSLKDAAQAQIELNEQILSSKRLEFELARLRNCGNLAKDGIQFHPRSPYYKICADVLIDNPPKHTHRHRHAISSEPSAKPESHSPGRAEHLGAPLRSQPLKSSPE